MKHFKDIKRQIDETSLLSPGEAQSTFHGRYKVDKSDNETVQQIRAAVARELDKNFMSPRTALNNLRTKLNHINLDFDLPEDGYDTGSVIKLPLKKATEVFGKDGDTPYDEYIKDDSSTGLTLEITISEDDNSLYKLTSKIK